ncbi:hypothetical protein M434DRAFT_28321 [Hypoxylon sp. CO27-5]|nr:hypothetical protein M434DRAFT_28321 [Hypoxylon sp. CO27-5]
MDDMKFQDKRVPIHALSNEILLSIFELDFPQSAILHCMLCCRRWWSLASSVLYKHVALTLEVLSRWSQCPSDSNDAMIETFTLRINPVGSGPGSIETADAMRQLRIDLNKLPSRLAKMVNLQSFSLFAPTSLPSGIWVPESMIASIIDSLPWTCVCLEINVRDTHDRSSAHNSEQAHLCDSIRPVLHRLRFLRLNLPAICPKAFGNNFDPAQPSDVSTSFKPIQAPILEQCIIKVAEPRPSQLINRSKVCNYPDANVIAVLAKHLEVFKSPTSAPKLQKLWILDVLPLADPYASYQSLVRRDVIANKSQALPYKDIAGPRLRKEGVLIRMPMEEGGQDLLSTVDGVKGLAEGHSWIEASNGTRIPASDISKKAHLAFVRPVLRTAEEWSAMTNVTCLLWSGEKRTGMRLLDAVEGGLTEDCIPTIRVPDGWRFNEVGILEMSE